MTTYDGVRGNTGHTGNTPNFTQRPRPNIRLNWQTIGDGPGRGEIAKVSFLRQGFFLSIVDENGNTNAITFVPRPRFRVAEGGRMVVEAEGGDDSYDSPEEAEDAATK